MTWCGRYLLSSLVNLTTLHSRCVFKQPNRWHRFWSVQRLLSVVAMQWVGVVEFASVSPSGSDRESRFARATLTEFVPFLHNNAQTVRALVVFNPNGGQFLLIASEIKTNPAFVFPTRSCALLMLCVFVCYEGRKRTHNNARNCELHFRALFVGALVGKIWNNSTEKGSRIVHCCVRFCAPRAHFAAEKTVLLCL